MKGPDAQSLARQKTSSRTKRDIGCSHQNVRWQKPVERISFAPWSIVARRSSVKRDSQSLSGSRADANQSQSQGERVRAITLYPNREQRESNLRRDPQR